MPDIPDNVEWRKVSKHRVKVAVWDASDARRSSRDDGPAKYNPKIYDDPTIEALERLCITAGTVVFEDAATGTATCYMSVGDKAPYVGVCSGEYTHFVWVEMYARTLHGYPISEQLLRERLRRRGLPGP